MSNLWQFYLFFGVILGIATTIFSIVLVTSVSLWFRKHLGVAMGALWSFQGIGTILFIVLIGTAFNTLGMKWIFWLPGILGGGLILLLIRSFYNEPAQIGLRPLGIPEDEPTQTFLSEDAAKIRARVFLQQAQRTRTFWNLIAIHYWGCMGHNILNVLLVAIAVDRGLSLGLAAGLLAVQHVTGVMARGTVPVIADHVGSKSVWVVGMSLQAFSLLIILFPPTTPGNSTSSPCSLV
jgi:MFS family permease